jgi:hypothetical protein
VLTADQLVNHWNESSLYKLAWQFKNHHRRLVTRQRTCLQSVCYLPLLLLLHPQAPALAWDEKLAASAQAWAATCQFAVSGMPGVAEGLGYGYSSLPEAIKDWYAQVRAAAAGVACVCCASCKRT